MLEKTQELRFQDGSCESIRLFGVRVDFGELTGTADDVQPSSVKRCICILDSRTESGWFLTCRSTTDLLSLADRLCFAGCIMRDLAQHCALARDKQLPSTMRSAYTFAPAYVFSTLNFWLIFGKF